MMGWIWSLLAISLAVATALIVLTLPSLGAPGRPQLFARFSIAAGISAVGSTLMYAIYEVGGATLALVVGDTFMVLGPGSIVVALGALSGRLRSAVVVVSCVVVVVAGTSALVGNPVAMLVKLIALVLLCLLSAAATRLPPVVGAAGARTLWVVNLAYAAFSFGRIVVGFALGTDSTVYQVAFSIYPTTAVGAVAVAVTGVGVIRMARELGVAGGGSTDRAESGFVVGGWWVSLPKSAELRAAFGRAAASRLAADLKVVCDALRVQESRGSDATQPAGSTQAGSTQAGSTQAFSDRLRAELESRGWSETEVAVVAIVPERYREGNVSGGSVPASP